MYICKRDNIFETLFNAFFLISKFIFLSLSFIDTKPLPLPPPASERGRYNPKQSYTINPNSYRKYIYSLVECGKSMKDGGFPSNTLT